MQKNLAIQDIVNRAIMDITKRVAHIELHQIEADFDENDDDDICSLSTDVAGAYKITITYHAKRHLMRTIAEQMKRAPAEDDEEIAIYTKEYFNILCGHVVTTINKITNSSARFGVPKFSSGSYSISDNSTPFFEIFYDSKDGGARIQGLCGDSDVNSGPLGSLAKNPITVSHTATNYEKEHGT